MGMSTRRRRVTPRPRPPRRRRQMATRPRRGGGGVGPFPRRRSRPDDDDDDDRGGGRGGPRGRDRGVPRPGHRWIAANSVQDFVGVRVRHAIRPAVRARRRSVGVARRRIRKLDVTGRDDERGREVHPRGRRERH